MKHGSRAKWLAGGAVVIAAVFLAAWNLQLIPGRVVSVGEMNANQLGVHGQRVYAKLAMTNISSTQSPDEVARLLDGAVVDDQGVARGAVAASESETSALLRQAGELLFYRHVQPSVEAYKQWRRAAGYRLVPTEYLINGYTVPQDYELIFAEKYPGDDRFEEVFDRFWAFGIGPEREGSRIVGVSPAREARVVAFGRLSREDPGSWPLHDDGLGIHLWRARVGGELRNWWTPPGGELRPWLDEVGSARCAVVSLICEFASGRRFPIHLRYVQDPRSGNWWFVGMGVSNDVDQTVGTTEL